MRLASHSGRLACRLCSFHAPVHINVPRASADASVSTSNADEPEQSVKNPEKAVQEALKSAKSAAQQAEQQLDRIHKLPSARKPNPVLDFLKYAMFRVFLISALSGTAWYLLAHQSAGLMTRLLVAGIGTLVLAGGGYLKGSLDPSGACAAVAVGLGTMSSSYAFASILIAFFVSSSALTRIAGKLKANLDSEYKPKGQRDWRQVACNGFVPTALAVAVAVLTQGSFVPFLGGEAVGAAANVTALQGAVLGYYACCCGDTWASEVGVLSISQPVLITSGKRVRKGTNGGVSALGLSVSLAGGLLVGLVGAAFTFFGAPVSEVATRAGLVVVLGAVAGLVGSLIDSVLGAVMQFSGYDLKLDKVVNAPGRDVHRISGVNLLSNNQVNLLSASLTASLSATLAVKLFGGV